MSFINWNELDSPQEYVTLFGIMAAIATGVIAWIRSSLMKVTLQNYQDTIQSYKDRLEAVEQETKLCQTQHHDSLTKIGELKGQLQVLKDVPLKQIADNQNSITKNQQKLTEMMHVISENHNQLTTFAQQLSDQGTAQIKAMITDIVKDKK